MSYLTINGTDVSRLVKGLKIGYETLVADGSGRNAAGDTVLDIINRKVKLYVIFKPMDDTDMSELLSAIGPYVVDVGYRDSKTNATRVIQCYHGTPEPEYYWIHGKHALYKEFGFNFIEM